MVRDRGCQEQLATEVEVKMNGLVSIGTWWSCLKREVVAIGSSDYVACDSIGSSDYVACDLHRELRLCGL